MTEWPRMPLTLSLNTAIGTWVGPASQLSAVRRPRRRNSPIFYTTGQPGTRRVMEPCAKNLSARSVGVFGTLLELHLCDNRVNQLLPPFAFRVAASYAATSRTCWYRPS